ncbi:NADPH dehydrogenase NamA [uncultured Clostridium sp.]|uniref:NADPH dehydrogenase NamA n=1 Tax=uncultured Clostridium sp. TaxID=59620 RepID=UPI002635F293|nr:NADPH dehydrogenase NamA [uncultured Clostridium sp.]
MSKGIFKSFKIKNLDLKNRIVMAPMCMYMAENDGVVTDFHYIHYTNRALGGVSAIILEATAVESRGRISDRDLGIWDDTHIAGLKKLTEGIKKYGAYAGIQLGHAGRKCGVSAEEIIAPSEIRFSDEYKTPMEMTKKEIEEVIVAFREGARRALEAGFDFIEIHGAHGYLISEFLSPLSNKRTDEYGGIPENRARFAVEVIRAIKEVWPADKAIFFRVSSNDYVEGGNTKVEMANIVSILKMEGIDLINVSTGAVVSDAVINAYPGYQVKDAEYIKEVCDIPVMAGGLITTGDQGTEIIENGRADLVFLARVLLRDPYWVFNEAKKRNIELDYLPEAYARGI